MTEMGQYSRNKMQERVRNEWEPSNRRMRRRWYEQDITLGQSIIAGMAIMGIVAVIVRQAWFR